MEFCLIKGSGICYPDRNFTCANLAFFAFALAAIDRVPLRGTPVPHWWDTTAITPRSILCFLTCRVFIQEHDPPSDSAFLVPCVVGDPAEHKKIRNVSYYFIPIYSILTATKHFAQVSCKGETQSEGRMDSTRKNICRLRYRHTIVFLLRDQIASPRS